ncbi:MAG: DUF2232 domain-containing protein [Candidatus Rokuibacteriota bacterium]
MLGGQGPSRTLLLGAAMGVALLLVEAGEGRLGSPGRVTALMSLMPTAIAIALGGPVGGTAAIVVAAAGATTVMGGTAAVAVLLRHALPGVVLGLVVSRRLSVTLSLVAVGVASAVGLALLLWVYLPVGTGVLPFVGRQFEAHVAGLQGDPGWLGLPGEPAWVAETARLAASALRMVGPALVLVGMFLVALVNYVGTRLVIRADGFRPFAQEAVPDHLVWLVIAGGLLVASGQGTVQLFGLNLLIALVPLYAIQGLAVLRHFFQRVRVPRPLQGLSFGLFAVQPLLLIAAACLGLTDLWVDFRKIRQAPTPA